ncbi:MAG TPA: DUF5916 domain-containing protein [Bacteroidales bacterium]|nr:DUF5916 domain-containing protein [Bacteroidales bacterium]
MKLFTGFAACMLISVTILASPKKNVEALRIQTPLTIDAILDEAVYSQVAPATDFTQLQPYNGKPSAQPSKVWFFYDENAIYVGAMLYDSAPDSIFNFLTERDNIGTSDYVGVYLDPYNQGQLSYGFFLTPAGVQVDIKAIKTSDGDNETSSWDAVWESKTRVTDQGWMAELRIPFAALRFSENASTEWGMNIFRNIRRYNSNNSWNNVDRNISGFIHQEGTLSGLHNIKPPIRLSISPYVATYFEKNKFLYKGGLDLKYGINESFTLDMMLIPDFGQVQSDDQELNLSPYELYYNEKRQFFTEGTELFDRAGIFYSRRIGAAPKFSANSMKTEDEIVTINPSETQLVNATKISGRTSSGWGIGMLNAMSLPSYATLTDTVQNKDRNVQVQPFTNYNVSVVDKSLKYNSYVSLINTNVTMFGNPFRANVTATEFVLRNKKMTWALTGKGGISLRGNSSLQAGYAGYLGLDKNKGSVHFGVSQSFFDDRINFNDLGYLQRNNELVSNAYVYYQHTEPFWIFREVSGNVWSDYGRMYNPWAFSKVEGGFNLNLNFKNNYNFYWGSGVQGDSHDYYETRTKGRFYKSPSHYWHDFEFNTDWRKPLSFTLDLGGNKRFETEEYGYYVELGMDLRIGQHLNMSLNANVSNQLDEYGFYAKEGADILFSKRDVNSLTNVLEASYVINNKMSINLRARHYWSSALNKTYELLQPDGSLIIQPIYSGRNQNYNAFSVDSYFRWVFAPGSEMVAAWKNGGEDFQYDVVDSYAENLKQSMEHPMNSFSLKLLYYIDYNTLKNKLKK